MKTENRNVPVFSHSSDIPPPIPPDTDLREKARWFKLDFINLFNSDFMQLATGEEFKAAFALWTRSLHQVPAGSLPNNEIIIARLAGYNPRQRTWKAIREMALYGWTLCDDGRLYHPTVTGTVLDMTSSSAHQAARADGNAHASRSERVSNLESNRERQRRFRERKKAAETRENIRQPDVSIGNTPFDNADASSGGAAVTPECNGCVTVDVTESNGVTTVIDNVIRNVTSNGNNKENNKEKEREICNGVTPNGVTPNAARYAARYTVTDGNGQCNVSSHGTVPEDQSSLADQKVQKSGIEPEPILVHEPEIFTSLSSQENTGAGTDAVTKSPVENPALATPEPAPSAAAIVRDGAADSDGRKTQIPMPMLGAVGAAPKAASLTLTDEIFAYWQKAMNKPRARLDAKRRRRIDWALKHYSAEECRQAINGCTASRFHMGENKDGRVYNDLILIFRDAAHVEDFMALAPRFGTGAGPGEGTSAVVAHGGMRAEKVAAVVNL